MIFPIRLYRRFKIRDTLSANFMRLKTSLWIVMILISACAPRTTLEVTGYRSQLLKQYTKVFTSGNFDLQIKYVGMNDSSFTFEMYLKNKSKSAITLDCSASELSVDLCSAAFESRIKSHLTMKADIKRSGEFTAWLQFKVLGDNPLSCFLNGGTMRLSNVSVITPRGREDCGIFEFVPITVRLY